MKNLHLNKRYFCIICLFCVSMINPVAAIAKSIENLSILVPSCDKYSEAWKPFFTLLFKYWPDLDQKIYLIGNQKTYSDQRIVPVLFPNEKSWSDNMLAALEKIPDDYVMIMLEDYFITHRVDTAQIEKLFKQMQAENAAFLQLQPRAVAKLHDKIENFGYISENQDYRTALQIVIWDKAILKSLLKSDENPWEFELDGTVRSRAIQRPFMSVTGTGPIQYIGGIWRGYWVPEAIALLEKEQIAMEYKLPIASKLRFFVMNDVRSFISNNVLQPIKSLLGMKNKRILPTEI